MTYKLEKFLLSLVVIQVSIISYVIIQVVNLTNLNIHMWTEKINVTCSSHSNMFCHVESSLAGPAKYFMPIGQMSTIVVLP
jgi:hypothetical protein